MLHGPIADTNLYFILYIVFSIRYHMIDLRGVESTPTVPPFGGPRSPFWRYLPVVAIARQERTTGCLPLPLPVAFHMSAVALHEHTLRAAVMVPSGNHPRPLSRRSQRRERAVRWVQERVPLTPQNTTQRCVSVHSRSQVAHAVRGERRCVLYPPPLVHAHALARSRERLVAVWGATGLLSGGL